MLHRRHILGAAVAAAALPLLAGGALAQEPEYTLKLHHLLGPNSPAQKNMLEPWAEEIEKDSHGRIDIEIYPSMSLGGAPPQLIRQVRDGVVDIIWTLPGYTPELFPRTEVFELPSVFNGDITATNLAMRDIYDKWLSPEYDGLKVITLHVHGGQGIQTRDKPIHSPQDMAGLKIRIPTRTGAWVLESLGATPVGMPVPDLPQALSTGAVDGALIPWEIIPALKIQELTDYQIEGPNHERLGTSTFMIAMNKDVYDSMPPDLQQVIDEDSGEEFAKQVGQVWRGSEDAGIAVAIADGNQLIVLTDEEMQAFRDAMAPVTQRWLDDVTAKGIDGQGLLDAAKAAIAKRSQSM